MLLNIIQQNCTMQLIKPNKNTADLKIYYR